MGSNADRTLKVRCPAAVVQAGPPLGGPSVLCGVMVNERETLATGRERRGGGAVLTVEDDPSTLSAFCCAEYVECPVWVAEKRRIEESKRQLVGA